MTRDEIAVQIACAILSTHVMILPGNKEKLARVSYEYADALIAEGIPDDG